MKTPTTWDEAAWSYVNWVWTYDSHSTWNDPVALYDQQRFADLAVWAKDLLHGSGWNAINLHTLLVRKQKDYGHENIERFGLDGVKVRLWDKVARFENLKGQETASNESTDDTLCDIIGYCTIHEMVCDGTFSLPLIQDHEAALADVELDDRGDTWGAWEWEPDLDVGDWSDWTPAWPDEPELPPPNGPTPGAFRLKTVGENDEGHAIYVMDPWDEAYTVQPNDMDAP